MTPPLDDQLRAMLRERADDITTVPARVLPPAADPDAAPVRGPVRTPRWRNTLLVAASVVTVLALAAGLLVAHVRGTDRPAGPGGSNGSTPPATAPPTTAPPTPTVGHAARQVPLSTFGVELHGFTRISYRGDSTTQRLSVRPAAETDLPRACQGCTGGEATAYVTVHAKGDFDPTDLVGRHPVTGGPAGTIGGTYRYDDTRIRVTTLAWPLSGGRWALAQGLTSLTAKVSTLLTLARESRPDVRSPIALPLQLRRLPAGYPVSEVDVSFTPGSNSVKIGLGPPSGPSLSIELWRNTPLGQLALSPATDVRVGGRPGRLGADRLGLASTYAPNRIAVLSMDVGSGKTTVATRELQTILGGLRWTPSGTTIPAEQAIP